VAPGLTGAEPINIFKQRRKKEVEDYSNKGQEWHFNINTAYLLVVLVLGVGSGWFIDKYGPRLSILIGSVVGALGPSVAGRIAEATDSYQLLYLLGAVANVLFVVMTLFVKPTRVELEMNVRT
jgi:MFS family permease